MKSWWTHPPLTGIPIWSCLVLRKDGVMPVVTLSSDSHPLGREIAGRAATALGYDCVDREILSAVADRHDVPETGLHKALEESPSPFGISSKNHARYLAYIEEATLAVLLKDHEIGRASCRERV